MAACAHASCKCFGANYDEYKALDEQFETDVEEIASRILPRFHYLCCIPLCQGDRWRLARQYTAQNDGAKSGLKRERTEG